MRTYRAIPGAIILGCTATLALAGFSGTALAAKGPDATASSRCKTYKIAGKKVRVCNGLNGKNGGSGPAGAPGSQGPQGPAGANGGDDVFNTSLRINQPSTTVFDQNGVRIEASCPDAELDLFVTPETTSDHNIIENTVFDNAAQATLYYDSFSVEGGTQVNMLDGDVGVDDYNGLLTVRLDPGGQITFIQWWASGGKDHPQGNCLVGGTASF
ncbi:MAG: hypothetical protein WAU42_02795 [Solirubrobacteraceae bacterium]